MNFFSRQSNHWQRAQGLPPLLLIVIYLFLSALPLVLAVFQGLPYRAFPNELASAFGLIGFTWVLLSFLLSGRFRTISGQIGIDKTMRLHQLMAIFLGLFIVLHPFFYSLPMNSSLPWDATGQYSLVLTLPAFMSGMLAWLLLPVLILTAVYRDQLSGRYEKWRLLHGIGAMVVVLASLHHILEVGRYSQDIMMRLFWFGLFGLALLTPLRSYLVMPMLQKKRPFRVVSVEQAATKTWHITVAPDQETMPEFKAGQFGWLKLRDETFSLTEHPFSISSAPSDLPNVRFTIKESGDFTNKIGEVLEGARAYIDGPHGHFIIDDHEYEDSERLVMIAGGIGVAPMISIIREMVHRQDSRPVTLLYGNRHQGQIVFGDELEHASKEIKLDVRLVLSEPAKDWAGLTAVLDSSFIQSALDMPHPEKCFYLLCGPPAMLNSAVEALIDAGVPRKKIIYEKFAYL